MQILIVFSIFIYIFHKARLNILNVLAIPFFMAYGPAATLDQVPFGLLYQALRNINNVCFVSLICAWIIIRKVKPQCLYKLINDYHIKALLFFIIIVIINAIDTILQHGTRIWVLSDIFPQLCFFSFFIFYDIFRRFDNEEITDFFLSVVLINTFLIVPYLINSLHILNIYSPAYVAEDILAAGVLPIWGNLSICFLITIGLHKVKVIFLIVINLIGIYVSSIRSLITVSLITLTFGLYFGRSLGTKSSRLKSIASVSVVVIISCAILVYLFPSKTELVTEKFMRIQTAGGIQYEANFKARVDAINDAFNYSMDRNPIFGFGLVGESSLSNIYGESDVAFLSLFRFADNTWTSFLMRHGLVGTLSFVFFLITYFMSTILSGPFRIKNDPIYLTALLLFLWDVNISFFSWNYIHNPCMALWYFPLLSSRILAARDSHLDISYKRRRVL